MVLSFQAVGNSLSIAPEELCQAGFENFGTVIENPVPTLVPSPHLKKLPPNAILANQGSALKYVDVTKMRNLYSSAPSHEQGKAIMSMFVCGPRSLLRSENGALDGTFPVEVLERHPFTTQTFVPLGLSPSEAKEARYLVIVAPTLPSSSADSELPVPSTADFPGRGLPDIAKMKAFIANGSQAVTYGAGTWHAPMVVVGKRQINFVVTQFSNGVGLEDCQEVEWKANGGRIVMVAVPKVHEPSKL